MPTIEEMRAQLEAEELNPSIDQMRADLEKLENQEQPLQTQILNEGGDLKGRMAMKAFGTDVGSKIKFYQEENKDKDIIENPYNKGEIIYRNKGSSEWRREDPPNWQGLQELGKDILDIPVDVAQGAVTGLTAAGAAALTPFTPVAGAALGGTAGFYGTEAIRQGIGKYFGQQPTIPSFGDVLATGALESTGAKLFGPGISKQKFTEIAKESPAVAKKALNKAEKYFLEEGQAPTPEEAIKAGEYLYEKSKGSISKIGKNLLPIWFGGQANTIEMASQDVPKSVVSDLITKTNLKIDPSKKWTYRELSQALELQKANKSAGVVAVNELKSSVANKKFEFGQRYDDALNSVTKNFPLDEYRYDLKKEIVSKGKSKTKEMREEANVLKNVLDGYFTTEPKTVTTMETVKQELPILDPSGKPYMSEVQVPVNKSVPSKQEVGVRELQRISSALKAKFGVGDSYGQIQNLTPAEQQARTSVLNIAKKIDNTIEDSIEDNNLRSDYASFMKLQDEVQPMFKDDKTAAVTLSNAYNSSAKQKALLQSLREFDSKFKTNLEPLSKLAFTGKRFGDPALEQISGSSTSTGKFLRPASVGGAIGTIAGTLTGEPTVFAPIGFAAGSALGGLSATDAVLNRLLGAKEYLNRGAAGTAYDSIVNMNPYAREMMMQPWLRMTNKKEENK